MAQQLRQLLAADMWPIAMFEIPKKRIDRFNDQARPAYKRLVEGLLLYDKVVIPTQDFLALTSLVSVLGERSVIDLFDAGAVRFVRFKGTLAYVGNGGGIKFCEMFNDENRRTPQPFCAPLEDAVNFALSGLAEKPKDRTLANLIVDATTEVNLQSVNEVIRHETYMDVLNSDHLRNTFAVRNSSMDHLAGITPNQVRTFGGVPWSDHWQGDEIDAVLAIAFANLELRLAQLADCYDASTVSPIGHLLRGKIERTLGASKASAAFANLRELAEIPDIGEGILTNQVSVADIIKLKNTSDGEQFRKWFHETCSDNPEVAAREYCKILRQVPKVQSLPARVIRFLTANLTGFLPFGAVLSPAVGTVNSFFIDRWFRGPSPKYFLDSLGKLINK